MLGVGVGAAVGRGVAVFIVGVGTSVGVANGTNDGNGVGDGKAVLGGITLLPRYTSHKDKNIKKTIPAMTLFYSLCRALFPGEP